MSVIWDTYIHFWKSSQYHFKSEYIVIYSTRVQVGLGVCFHALVGLHKYLEDIGYRILPTNNHLQKNYQTNIQPWFSSKHILNMVKSILIQRNGTKRKSNRTAICVGRVKALTNIISEILYFEHFVFDRFGFALFGYL